MSGPNVVVRVDEEQLKKWDEYCKQHNLSRSELIRTAVFEKINGQQGEMLNKIDEVIFYYFNSLKQLINQKIA